MKGYWDNNLSEMDFQSNSDKLGGGNYVNNLQPPKEFRANAAAFISDVVATTSYHTSGETFLNDIQIISFRGDIILKEISNL